MTATLNDEVADLRRTNAELQERLDERTAERDDAEAQRTTISEVLEVINASPGEPTPVFDAILRKAHDLCGAELGVLLTYDGDCYWPLAAHGTSARFLEHIRERASVRALTILSRECCEVHALSRS